MNYCGSIRIKQDAPPFHLHALLHELRAMDCVVRLDLRRHQLEFDLPEHLYFWVRAGGLAKLLGAFPDVVTRFPSFYEVADEPKRTGQLPSPKQGGKSA